MLSSEEFVTEQENKNTTKKTEHDVRLLEGSLKTKDNGRKIEDFSAAELNEYDNLSSSSVLMASRWCQVRANFNCQLQATLEEKGQFCWHNQLVSL